MKQHEREFFICTIRSGKVFVKDDIVIKAPTNEQHVQSCIVYNKSYEEAFDDEVMTEEEMLNWMIEHGLWSYGNDAKIKGLEKDIERLKVEIYNARNDEKLAKNIRLYIRAGEKQLAAEHNIKHQYYQNTCEGLAHTDKVSWTIQNTTYKGDKLYNFNDMSIQVVLNAWQSSILRDAECRELARNEPWKSLWSVHEKSGGKLFFNDADQELTHNQKSLLIWSQMYDNIQESVECPTADVINDDDMLDGWFIVQSKKRDKERAENEFENSTNEKIKNSSEIFVVAKTDRDKQRIESMNDTNSQVIKRQRAKVLEKQGTAEQHHFPDEILRIKAQQTEAWKNRGGK